MKSHILKFSSTLDGVTDLHTMEPPIWACQRKTTLADVFSYFLAIFNIAGLSKTSCPVIGGPDVMLPWVRHGLSADPKALYAFIKKVLLVD